jgi:hypothetical protein
MSQPRRLLYELPTRIWLNEVAPGLGRPAKLDDIPDGFLVELAALGFDWLWLMGIWQTGPTGRAVSRTRPEWRADYERSLPGYRDDDICGSPFAVRDYQIDSDFGGTGALLRLRGNMARHGIALMLDLVPNHTALDHPWVSAHPEYYIQGSQEDLAREPGNFCRLETRHGPRIFAHGRDPYFPGWPDTVQLNHRHGGLRAAMMSEMMAIASLCDGVRADMAMLLLPDVFLRTWGDRSLPGDGSAPVDTSFWPEAIRWVRGQYPRFVFMAEAYWDLEARLQAEGFDYTYDKHLYDALRAGDASTVRRRLAGGQAFLARSVHFLENHDEPRSAAVFPPAQLRAALVITLLALGLRFVQDGQFEGRRLKASIHLSRRANEPINQELKHFCQRLLACAVRPEVLNGSFHLAECLPAWESNPTFEHFIAFGWEAQERLLVVVNYGPTQGQCRIKLPFAGLDHYRLGDLLSAATYDRSGDTLFVDMPAWGYHAFVLAPL